MPEQSNNSRNSVRQNAGSKKSTQQRGRHWLGWASRHPGVVLLGAMLVVALALPKPIRIRDVERDTTGEEVPLFV